MDDIVFYMALYGVIPLDNEMMMGQQWVHNGMILGWWWYIPFGKPLQFASVKGKKNLNGKLEDMENHHSWAKSRINLEDVR